MNSVTASSDGALEDTQLTCSARDVLAEIPSSVVPYAAACPPPRRNPVSPPTFFDSGVRAARSNGLRNAPPTTKGNWSTILLVTVALVFASSVWSCTTVACTSTNCFSVPTCSVTSARTFAAAFNVKPVI